MSIDKRIPRTPEEAAAGVFQVEDIGEAQTRASTEKPFRDAATDEGPPDTDKEVLNRVADEKGDKSGLEYREMKEASATEIMAKLGRELREKLEASKLDNDMHFATELSRRFAEQVAKMNARKKTEEERRGSKVNNKKDWKYFGTALSISPVNVIMDSNRQIAGFPNANNDRLSEEAENALYQVLGVGENRVDVVDAFRKLSPDQVNQVAEAIGERSGSISENGYAFSVPTKIEGVYLYLNKATREKNASIILNFAPEFLAQEIK